MRAVPGEWGDWLDTEKLRWLLLAPIGLVVVGLYLVVRFVGKFLMKVALVVVLVGLGVSVWLQRADLAECAETCSCTLFGRAVQIPADKNPNC